MARITVEDCLAKIPNRFELIHIASKRVKQMAKGSLPLIPRSHNKPAVLALREVAVGLVLKLEHDCAGKSKRCSFSLSDEGRGFFKTEFFKAEFPKEGRETG